MFEKIILRRSDTHPVLTVGELAEALLFYQNVHLVLDDGSLNDFISQIGMPRLLTLLSRSNVSAVYCEETLGTRTTSSGSTQYHDFVAFTLSGTQEKGALRTRKERLQHLLDRHGYKRREIAKLIERFRRHVPIRKLTDDYFMPGGVVRAATTDLLDVKFVQEAMRRAVSRTVGADSITGSFAFEVIPGPSNFSIYTDLDFAEINSKRKQVNPSLDPITPAHLVTELLMARADTALAAHYGGEFYTSEISSEIVRLRYAELLRRIGIEKAELRELKDIVISDARSVREVIDRGERSFDEFLSLLEKSQKFRDWIRGVNPDEKIVHAYVRDITAEGWIAKLPSKSVRYALSTLSGLVEPFTGAAVSAADSFLLDKIFAGWRPSHFVEKQLKPFLKATPDSD